jgi:colanic acid/amylovoran biosynthesis glycosyltransferase
LDACSVLKRNNIAFTYTIVGAKGYLELMYQIKDLDLENHVVLLDSIPMNEVKKTIQAASLLLLPSVEEGIANVVLEAMALRTLVLTTNCGGMEEVVKDEVNGFVCPLRDANAMAEQIMKIEKIPNIDKVLMLDRAQNTIEKQHSETQMVGKMIDLYDKVINGDMT